MRDSVLSSLREPFFVEVVAVDAVYSPVPHMHVAYAINQEKKGHKPGGMHGGRRGALGGGGRTPGGRRVGGGSVGLFPCFPFPFFCIEKDIVVFMRI